MDESPADDRLVEPLPATRVNGLRAYWVAYPDGIKDLPALKAIREWLVKEIGA